MPAGPEERARARASEGVRQRTGVWSIPRAGVLPLLGSWHIHVPLGPHPHALTAFPRLRGCCVRLDAREKSAHRCGRALASDLSLPHAAPAASVSFLPTWASRRATSSGSIKSQASRHSPSFHNRRCGRRSARVSRRMGDGPSGTWMCHDPSEDRTSPRGVGHPPCGGGRPSEASALGVSHRSWKPLPRQHFPQPCRTAAVAPDMRSLPVFPPVPLRGAAS